MIYEMEAIAATLKAEREKQGLSQRKLSERSGVPQSHISKIENADVDIRISSLNAIANALDLEISLIPRKVVPVVKSISQNVPNVPIGVAKQMAQMVKNINRVSTLNIQETAVSKLVRRLKELQRLENLLSDPSGLKRINETMKKIQGNDGLKAAQQAAQQMQDMRNRIAHAHDRKTLSERPRPAYQLDHSEDD